MRFDGKRVLVTGASRGIGRATAEGFARAGARVAVHYAHDQGAASGTIRRLEGDRHVTVQADLEQPGAARDLIDAVTTRLGGLDILVNNAGIYIDQAITEVDPEQWQEAWQRTLAMNLIAPADLIYWATKVMIPAGGGRVVCVGSRGAFRGEPDHPAYGASKAGLHAMAQSLAVALAPHNIFIGVVAPGFVETDMAAPFLEGSRGDAIRAQSPMGRVARPEEVAHAIMFLASDGAEFTTGAVVDVNGATYLRT